MELSSKKRDFSSLFLYNVSIVVKQGAYTLTFFHLECCLALSKHLNYTNAASALHISQPVLSRTISALEKEVGFPLFNRNSHNVSPSAAGKVFLRKAEQLLRDYSSALDEAKLAANGVSGEIRIGTRIDTFKPFLVDISTAIKYQRPDIQVILKEYTPANLVRAFADGKIDVVLDRSSLFPGEDLVKLPIRKNYPCVVTSPDSPLTQHHSLRLDQLSKEKFIALSCGPTESIYNYFWRLMMQADFSPNVVLETDSVSSLLMHVACNDGIAIFTDNLNTIAGNYVTFIPLVGIPLEEEALIWQNSNQNPVLPHLKKLLSII